jgi:hypothetical protein
MPVIILNVDVIAGAIDRASVPHCGQSASTAGDQVAAADAACSLEVVIAADRSAARLRECTRGIV